MFIMLCYLGLTFSKRRHTVLNLSQSAYGQLDSHVPKKVQFTGSCHIIDRVAQFGYYLKISENHN